MSVKAERISSRYQISDGNFSIISDISRHGKITLFTKGGHNQDFNFINSDPRIVKSIAEMMLETVRVSDEIKERQAIGEGS